jgi:transforming acidic coiled-coil-containing protein 3
MREECEDLKTSLLKATEENNSTKEELEDVKLKYKQLRLDHADLSESHTKLRETHETVKSSLESSTTRFTQLKAHAEGKLNEANIEIAKVRHANETETAGIKAKLLRAEMKVGTLERSMQDKIKENAELSRICDDLVQQIEAGIN